MEPSMQPVAPLQACAASAKPVWDLYHEPDIMLASQSTPEQSQRDVDDLLQATKLPLSHAILDLACGTGSHAHQLSRRGFSNVIGLDICPQNLVIATTTTTAASAAKPTFHLGDARYMPEFPSASFDAVLLLGNSLAYINASDRRNVLAEIARLLVLSHGVFVLDFVHREFTAKTLHPKTWDWKAPNHLVLSEQVIVDAALVTRRVDVLTESTKVSEVVYSEQLLQFEDLVKLLEPIGFVDISLVSRPDNSRHLVVAKVKSMPSNLATGYPCDVKDCGYGKGGYASRDIVPGELVQRYSGPVMPYDKVPLEEQIYCIWTWYDFYTVDKTNARYINHSCDPNCAVNPYREMRAKRFIKQGEELSIVYNHSEEYDYWDPAWNFDCKCGSANCQKVIDGYVNKKGEKLSPPK